MKHALRSVALVAATIVLAFAGWQASGVTDEAAANPPYKMIEICWNGETVVVPLWKFKQGEFPGATEGPCEETPPPTTTEPPPTTTEPPPTTTTEPSPPPPAEPPPAQPPAQPPIVEAPPTSNTPSLPLTGEHWWESRFLWAGLLGLVALSLLAFGIYLNRRNEPPDDEDLGGFETGR